LKVDHNIELSLLISDPKKETQMFKELKLFK